jgi:preprotein translocase subunit SecB
MENIPVSEFKFETFFIRESFIKRDPFSKSGNYNIDIIPNAVIDRKNQVYQLDLTVNITNETKCFSASVSAVGLFKYNDTMQQDILDNYFLVNAPAIIYPYIRAYVSTLTGFSGIKSINLPLMNLTGIIPVLKEKTTIIE